MKTLHYQSNDRNVKDVLGEYKPISTKPRHRFARFYALFASLLTVASMAVIFSRATYATVQNPTATAKISFTFDDGLTSAATQALPVLSKYGLTGTSYVITKCVGMTTTPNTCHANNDASYMTWAQIKQLQSAGWEVASHTQTHPYLATSDATDGQPNVLTPAQVTQELVGSKSDLSAQGISAAAFATPYGDYNPTTLGEIAKSYTSHRGFADTGNNVWPYSDYLLNDMPVQAGVTVASVEAKIDAAIAGKYWLILTMHDIQPSPSTNPDDYQYATSSLDQIAAYVKAKQTAGLITPVTVSKGLVTSDTNLLPNSTFDSGIASGWTTDAPATITRDSATNGSMPSPTNSIKLTSSGVTTHLFSPRVTVDPSTTYLLKNFLKVTAITSGEVGFYIDEYDGSGNWLSGQYRAAERTAFTEELNFTYKPSSLGVKSARLQVIATGGSGITAYVDNAQWFALSSATTPAPNNLVTNGAFDAGITGGWTTDSPTNIVADSGSHGSPNNPVNSVALTATTKNIHLFSPHVTVDPTKKYLLTNYVAITQLASGEVGFYIDEYDINGNWISGRYITGVRSLSTGDVSLFYTPTSSSVKSASLQVIVTGNSGIHGYFDDARWYQQ
jgi:peptidoglycan/xylan/chitin deacetylase (PgdA/CDA1 family)